MVSTWNCIVDLAITRESVIAIHSLRLSFPHDGPHDFHNSIHRRRREAFGQLRSSDPVELVGEMAVQMTRRACFFAHRPTIYSHGDATQAGAKRRLHRARHSSLRLCSSRHPCLTRPSIPPRLRARVLRASCERRFGNGLRPKQPRISLRATTSQGRDIFQGRSGCRRLKARLNVRCVMARRPCRPRSRTWASLA